VGGQPFEVKTRATHAAETRPKYYLVWLLAVKPSPSTQSYNRKDYMIRNFTDKDNAYLEKGELLGT
jgi:hypothetical protein